MSTIKPISKKFNDSAYYQLYKKTELYKLTIIIAVISLGIFGTYNPIGLYADGSWSFLKILTTQTYDIIDTSRFWPSFLTQTPVILGIRMGLTDTNTLIRIHSLGLMAVPIIFWIITLILSIKQETFWSALAIFSAIYLNGGLMATGEYNTTYAISALSAALLLRNKISIINLIFLIIAAIILNKSYQAMVFLGPTLAGVAALRLSVKNTNSDSQETYTKVILVVLIIIYAYDSYSSLLMITHPRSEQNFNDATNILEAFRNRQLLYTIAMAILYAYTIYSTKKWKAKLTTGFAVILSIIFLTGLFRASPYTHYQSRAAIGAILMISIVFQSIIFAKQNILKQNVINTEKLSHHRTIASLLFLTLSFSFITKLSEFGNWIDRFETEVNSKTGIITSEETKMSRFSNYSTYIWTWTNPTLSIVLRENTGGAIVENMKTLAGWQPFNPNVSIPVIPIKFRKNGSLRNN